MGGLEEFWESYDKYMMVKGMDGLENDNINEQIKDRIDDCLEKLEEYEKQGGTISEGVKRIKNEIIGQKLIRELI